ncbi:hypothetical protein D920_02919 [Enterococcus faecalis 13-SD-W-01]|nr:hypothetical protein D920_02919 [Enterococcus faecalis 13-SD-W-01]
MMKKRVCFIILSSGFFVKDSSTFTFYRKSSSPSFSIAQKIMINYL